MQVPPFKRRGRVTRACACLDFPAGACYNGLENELFTIIFIKEAPL